MTLTFVNRDEIDLDDLMVDLKASGPCDIVAGGRTKERAIERFAETLRFPDWFGRNLDALYDLLDLSGKALSMATQPVGVEPAGSPNAKVPEQSEPAEQEPTSTITPDEITKAAVALIKRDRKNSVKIQAILKTYGVSQMSSLQPDKYEAFMRDLDELGKA